MKTLIQKTIFLILILTISFGFSQTKDAYFTPKKSNANLFVNAQVNGKPYKSLQVLAKSTLRNGKKGYAIVSVGETGRIEMKLEKELKVGTFVIDGNDKKSMMMFAPKQGMPYTTTKCSDAKGTLTVTEISEHTMSGTFSFTGKYMMAKCESAEKVNITNGSFKVSF